MSTEDLEKKFIEYQLQTPPYTVEEIVYLVNKDRSLNDEMSIVEVENWLENTKDKAKLQRAINDKKSRRNASMLITDLNKLINDLRDMITDIKNSDTTNKTIVQALKELRLTIMDIARLTGELQKQQDAKISNYYIPINRLEEYVQKRLKKFLEEKS